VADTVESIEGPKDWKTKTRMLAMPIMGFVMMEGSWWQIVREEKSLSCGRKSELLLLVPVIKKCL